MSRAIKEPKERENTFVDDRVSVLIEEFEAIVHLKPRERERGKSDLKGWKELVLREADLLMMTYPDEKPECDKTYLTCWRQIGSLRKELAVASRNSLKDTNNHYPVMTIVNHFISQLYFLFNRYKMRDNKDYRSRVKARSNDTNRIELDLTKFLERAHGFLTLASEGATNIDEVEWRDVSCALALVTGRRMAEIHLSAEFVKKDSHTVIFTGQLKGKCRKEDGKPIRYAEFEIPTLLEADLVIAAINWLEQNGKRLARSDDPERVNKRWGKVLSERIKTDWVIVADDVWKSIDEKDKMTYHKLRGCYFIASIKNHGSTQFSSIKTLAPILLGDNDITAVSSYERFEIKPGTLTKI